MHTNSGNENQTAAVPSSEQAAEAADSSGLSAAPASRRFRPYETHPERKVLRLDNIILLEFIKSVEERDFRTESDTGANSNALYIWNHVRRLAGLPDIEKSDLPAWCVKCRKYHQYPHERKPVTSEHKG